MLKNVSASLVALSLLTGCAPNSDSSDVKQQLADANKKIAALEAELEQIKRSPKREGNAGHSVSHNKNETPQPTETRIERTGQQWRYEADEDPMSGGKRYTASVKSLNTVSFGFPYAGDQHGTLTLRVMQGQGKDVLFYIERGQILCPSYQGCSVQVRFDDEKPIRFTANGPADHSSELVFLADYNKFISKMKQVKRVRIAVEIYQNGAPAFEFDVSGFDPDKYVPKS